MFYHIRTIGIKSDTGQNTLQETGIISRMSAEFERKTTVANYFSPIIQNEPELESEFES
jgi:hypothetical protein